MKEQASTEQLVKTAQALRAKGMTFDAIAKEMKKQKMVNSWGNPISKYNAQSYVGAGTKKTAQKVQKVEVPKKETTPIVMKWMQVGGNEADTVELITAIVATTLPPARKIAAIRRFVQ